MNVDQLPPVSYEELISGVEREIQFWDLPGNCKSSILALTPSSDASRAELLSFPLDGTYDPTNADPYRRPLSNDSFLHKAIGQILKNQIIWVEGIWPEKSTKQDLEHLHNGGLVAAEIGRYFLFPIPVVASPVVFFLLAPGPDWEGSAEGLCSGVLHLADRLSGLHLATNLLGAFMPEMLSGIPNEQELVALFSARIAQILLPTQYQINISDRLEPEKWQKFCLNIPSSSAVFKVPLRRRYYLMYQLATLKMQQVYLSASDRGLSKIKARKEHLRVLMERSYGYIYACWRSVTKTDFAVTESAQALTLEFNQLRAQLLASAERADALIDRLAIKLSGISSGNSNAFYRTSYGWMVFFQDQNVDLYSDQEDGFTCLHHLLAHPDISYPIDDMVYMVSNKSRRKQKKHPQINHNPDQSQIEAIEMDKLFSQRGFEFSAERLWEEVNPMGTKKQLEAALDLYEKKGDFSRSEYTEMLPEEKEKVLIRLLFSLVCQQFILHRLIQRFGDEAHINQCKEVEKKINQTTFFLKEDAQINPNPNASEFFEDIRIDFYGDQSVTSISKPKEEKKKAYENITKAIQRAIDNIGHAALQVYLREHIEIGNPCCYKPGSHKITWTTEVPT